MRYHAVHPMLINAFATIDFFGSFAAGSFPSGTGGGGGGALTFSVFFGFRFIILFRNEFDFGASTSHSAVVSAMVPEVDVDANGVISNTIANVECFLASSFFFN